MRLLVVALGLAVRANVDSDGATAEVVRAVDGLQVKGAKASMLESTPAAASPKDDSTGPDRMEVGEHCPRNGAVAQWWAGVNLNPFNRSRGRPEPNAVQPKWDLDDRKLMYAEYEINKNEDDFDKLKRYFYRFMPQSARLRKISMIGNSKLWFEYDGKLKAMQQADPNLYKNPCDVEKWLWHGTGSLQDVLRGGFKTAFSSMTYNVYGAGLYFAPDPRLANFFQLTDDTRGKKNVVSKLILVRVAAGKVGKKKELGWSGTTKAAWTAALTSAANRQPPPNADSATSDSMTEVITFQDNTAYPAYVFEYSADALKDADPYTTAEFKAKLGVVNDVMQDPLCECPSSKDAG